MSSLFYYNYDIRGKLMKINIHFLITLALIMGVASLAAVVTRADSPGRWDKAGVSMHGEHTKMKIDYEFIHVYKYEGCEYLYLRDKNRAGFTHKGNCKNPIHVD